MSDSNAPAHHTRRGKRQAAPGGTAFGLRGIGNNLTKLRPTRRERNRVTIFGSARARPGHWVYGEAKRMAGTLAEMGCDVVTDAGGRVACDARSSPPAEDRPGWSVHCWYAVDTQA